MYVMHRITVFRPMTTDKKCHLKIYFLHTCTCTIIIKADTKCLYSVQNVFLKGFQDLATI